MYSFIMSGWLLAEEDRELKAFYQRPDELTVEMGVIMWGYRVVIPKSLQNVILKIYMLLTWGLLK